MQETLFRGLTTPKPKGYEFDRVWVEGDLIISNGKYYIHPRSNHVRVQGELGKLIVMHEVIPETVVQYTGLNDKNGKKIFEGQIVRGRHWTSLNDKSPEAFHLWCVDWSEESGLVTFVDSPTTKARLSIHDFADFGEVEIVGNIHDNPELLKQK